MPANYVLLERTELNASAASVTFANIPQTGYTDLKVVISARTDYAGFLDLNMFFNGNASSGYSWRRLNGDGGSATSTNSTSAGVIPNTMLGTTATANTFANVEAYIPNYTSTTSKSASMDGVTENNATTSYTSFTAGLSTLSTAITSVSFGLGAGNFVQYSTFSLYGLAAVGTTPAIAPKASGGNRIDYDGTYWIHTFTSSGTFTPQTGLSCDYLVVAGGGGSAGYNGGGAGAGGLRSTVTATGGGGSLESALSVVSGTAYTVTVGAGGSAGNNANGSRGTNGSDSIFSTITSTGGGTSGSGSATLSVVNGSSGGSGGGAGGATGQNATAASGTTNQGYAGGDNFNSGGYGSGGGGGANAVGANGTTSVSGNGGAGVATSISGSSVTYAGGGGGGSTVDGATRGTGGTGGGGNGGASANAGTAGTVNLGGGGGGGAHSQNGAAGGSGIVIVRYLA
jgi:hypothetical protein